MRVQVPPGALMLVSCDRCVLSGTFVTCYNVFYNYITITVLIIRHTFTCFLDGVYRIQYFMFYISKINCDGKRKAEHIWCLAGGSWRETHQMSFSVQVRKPDAAKYSDVFFQFKLTDFHKTKFSSSEIFIWLGRSFRERSAEDSI